MTILLTGHRGKDLAHLVAEDWRESGKPTVTRRGKAYVVTSVSVRYMTLTCDPRSSCP